MLNEESIMFQQSAHKCKWFHLHHIIASALGEEKTNYYQVIKTPSVREPFVHNLYYNEWEGDWGKGNGCLDCK